MDIFKSPRATALKDSFKGAFFYWCAVFAALFGVGAVLFALGGDVTNLFFTGIACILCLTGIRLLRFSKKVGYNGYLRGPWVWIAFIELPVMVLAVIALGLMTMSDALFFGLTIFLVCAVVLGALGHWHWRVINKGLSKHPAWA
jgi:hypothetical protein